MMHLPEALLSYAVTGTHHSAMAQQVLIAAGQQAFQRQGGYIPKSCPASPPERCPSDEGEYCPEGLIAYLWLIYNHTSDFQHIFIQKFAVHRYRLPEEYLSKIIQDVEKGELEIEFLSLLGNRGLWLRIQMPVLKSERLIHANYVSNPAVIQAKKKFFASTYMFNSNEGQNFLRQVWQPKAVQPYYEFYLDIVFRSLSLTDEKFIEELGNYLDDYSLRQKMCHKLYNLSGSRFRKLVEQRLSSLLDYDPQSKEIILPEPGGMGQNIGTETDYYKWNLNYWDIIKIVPPNFWTEKWGISNHAFLSAVKNHKTLKYFLNTWGVSALLSGNIDFTIKVFYSKSDNGQHTYLKELADVANSLQPEEHLKMMILWLTYDHEKSGFVIPYYLLQHYSGIHTDEILSILLIHHYQKIITRIMFKLKATHD